MEKAKTRKARVRFAAGTVLVGALAVVALSDICGVSPTRPAAADAPAGTNTVQRKDAAMEVKLTNENFKAEVLKAEKPVLVDFWATWCGPCRMLGPVLSEVAAERAGQLKVGKVNVDEAPELAARYGITSIPAVLLFKGGKLVGTSVGFVPKDGLDAFLAQHLP